ncbi:MAG: hypothetical protein HQ512_07720 [Rhodospirillales bacterium]|nr:hypothetical protein [Rhodospirillales bacterium]
MDPVIFDERRRDLIARLPGMIDGALQRYLDFTRGKVPTEARNFAAYSSACRAAMAHLEQLIKLAQSLSSEITPPVSPNADLDRLIADAEATLE